MNYPSIFPIFHQDIFTIIFIHLREREEGTGMRFEGSAAAGH
jgi:hypothetical protein